MKRIRICLAVPGKIENKKLWSGTYFTLYSLLKNRDDIILSVLEYDFYSTTLYRYFYNPIRKIIFTWNSPQDFFVRYIIKQSIRTGLKKVPNEQDYYLFPACSCPDNTSDILKGKIVVYTDSYMADLNDNRGYRLGKYILSFVYRKNVKKDYNKVKILFTQNDWSKFRFSNCCNIPFEYIHNVRFGVNLEMYYGEKDNSQQTLLIVLRKGTERTKGLVLLCKAFPLVRQKFPQCRLAIVGSDYGKGIEGIDTYYNTPRSTTVELFKKCSLYVMPALREPNGITYLEALANKSPIVGLNRFAFPEFAGNGKWGFICKSDNPKDLADVICDALSNNDRLIKYGLEGQRFVNQNYNWHNTVEKIISILKQDISK